MTDPHSKNILVFGSTGGVGKAFVEQALAKGHRVTAFLRDRSKLAVDDPNLTSIDGDLFHEPSVKSALTPDLDAVFTAYGFSNKKPDNKHERVTQAVVEGMTASGVSRLVSVSSMGASDSAGIGPFWVRFVAKVILKHIIPDKTLQESVLKTSDLEWTILRPPMLVRKPATGEYTVWEGQKPPNKIAWKVPREDVAAEGLRCIESGDYTHKAMQISS
jgi:putative NADH-flavin reductase